MPSYNYSWNNPISGTHFWINDTLFGDSVNDAVVIEDTRFHFMFTLLESLGYIFNVSKIEDAADASVIEDKPVIEDAPAVEDEPVVEAEPKK